NGMFQGGNAAQIEHDFKLHGPEILYLGDHIFGDILTLKRHLAWRTGLIVEDLAAETAALAANQNLQQQIDQDMQLKSSLETQLNALYDEHIERQVPLNRAQVDQLFARIDQLDHRLQKNITQYQAAYNPHWGELMKAGNEASLFAGQVEKYACIYMPYLHNLGEYSPRTYFRPAKHYQPHEPRPMPAMAASDDAREI
ncbi:MAG: hypothetical protein J6Y94_03890, partial [Bacteriovoracaceae bacterium]|nr:hypothetical protein [Bacteriovoracaceae bacterium]